MTAGISLWQPLLLYSRQNKVGGRRRRRQTAQAAALSSGNLIFLLSQERAVSRLNVLCAQVHVINTCGEMLKCNSSEGAELHHLCCWKQLGFKETWYFKREGKKRKKKKKRKKNQDLFVISGIRQQGLGVCFWSRRAKSHFIALSGLDVFLPA